MGKVKAYGLREPEFIGGEVDLRINIYRNQLNATSAAQDIPQHNVSADKVPTNEQERQIYNYVLENPSITTTQAATLLNIGQRRARNLLVKMVDDRWLNKEGASRSTVYVINPRPCVILLCSPERPPYPIFSPLFLTPASHCFQERTEKCTIMTSICRCRAMSKR